jgi:arginase family enzyme
MADMGITSAVNNGLRLLLNQELELWLHFDVDVVDPLEMPAVHFPEPGGMSMKEVQILLEEVLVTDKVLGLSIACYHSDVDADLTSAGGLVRMLSEVLI